MLLEIAILISKREVFSLGVLPISYPIRAKSLLNRSQLTHHGMGFGEGGLRRRNDIAVIG